MLQGVFSDDSKIALVSPIVKGTSKKTEYIYIYTCACKYDQLHFVIIVFSIRNYEN